MGEYWSTPVVHLNPTAPEHPDQRILDYQDFSLGIQGRASIAQNARQGSKANRKKISDKVLREYAEMDRRLPSKPETLSANPRQRDGKVTLELTFNLSTRLLNLLTVDPREHTEDFENCRN